MLDAGLSQNALHTKNTSNSPPHVEAENVPLCISCCDHFLSLCFSGNVSTNIFVPIRFIWITHKLIIFLFALHNHVVVALLMCGKHSIEFIFIQDHNLLQAKKG